MRPYQDVHHGAYYCGAICAEASEHGANQTDPPDERAWCLICRAEIPPAPDPEVVIDVVAMVTVTINRRTGRVVRRVLTEHGQVSYLSDEDGGDVESWAHAATCDALPPEGTWDDAAEIAATWALARYRAQLLADADCHYPIMPAIQENTDPECWMPPRRGWTW